MPWRIESDPRLGPTVRSSTISIGAAELEKGWGVDDLFKSADEMMYQAKGDGRNCVRPERLTEPEE